MASTEASSRGAAEADMEMLRAEIRVLGKRLSREQMRELADLMAEIAGAEGERRSWRPEGASPP